MGTIFTLAGVAWVIVPATDVPCVTLEAPALTLVHVCVVILQVTVMLSLALFPLSSGFVSLS